MSNRLQQAVFKSRGDMNNYKSKISPQATHGRTLILMLTIVTYDSVELNIIHFIEKMVSSKKG